jgi:GT2 family glycosyltransferase
VSFSIVILSRDANNLVPCVRAILENEPKLFTPKIVVVDDGAQNDAALKLPHLTWVAGVSPFVFARNANLGIKRAMLSDADVILLNDDALLETVGGFTALSKAAQQNPQYGVISAACNNVGNENQHHCPDAVGVRTEARMVCFVAVYIPRRTLDMVGLLDERYCNGYGIEDDDFCLRSRRAGLKIGIFDGCRIDHKTLKSSFRTKAHADFRPNLRLFIEKWGVDNRGQSKEDSPYRELFPGVDETEVLELPEGVKQ